jgi:hypothetical protein
MGLRFSAMLFLFVDKLIEAEGEGFVEAVVLRPKL